MYQRFSTENRKDVADKIKRAQRSLDKMHVKLQLSKEVRHKHPNEVYEVMQRVGAKYGKRCNLSFLEEVVTEMMREYYLDKATHLFIDNYVGEHKDTLELPMSNLELIPRPDVEHIPYAIEINTHMAWYCISVTAVEDYCILETNMLFRGKFKHGYSFVYDKQLHATYVVIDDTLQGFAVKNPTTMETIIVKGISFPVLNIGDGMVRIDTAQAPESLIRESMYMAEVALNTISDYIKTLEDTDKYKRPSTVEKHRAKRTNVDMKVISKEIDDDSVHVREVYVKMSDLIKKRTGVATGQGTPHSHHSSPCEHTRRATKRRLKDGRLIDVKETIVNKGHKSSSVKTILVDK